MDDAPVRGLRDGQGVQRALQVPARARRHRPVAWPSTCRPSSASTPTTRAASARSAAPASRSTRSTTCGPRSTASRSTRSRTSMTINAPASVLLLLYELVAEEQGVDAREAPRHGPERHPQGVHRPRELHLPARAEHAADDRPVRLLPRATSRSGTRSRSPATTSARRAPAPSRRSPSRSPTAWPTCRRRSTPASKVDDFAPAPGLLLQRPQQRLPGGREVPRRPQHVGARDEGALRRARTRSRMMLRFHTQTGGVTLTAQQPQNNIVRVALQALRRGLRRHPVAAHQRLRRGARAADRARRQDRAAHAADRRPRVGRRPTPSTRSPAPTSSSR